MRHFRSSRSAPYGPAWGSEDVVPLQPPVDEAALPAAIARDFIARRIQAARRQLASATGFVIDLDGTLVSGSQLMPGAKELLEHAKDRYAIVSNNSRDTAVTLARKLGRLGLRTKPEHMVLAGEQAVRLMIERYPGSRVRIVASPVLAQLAAALGGNVVEHEPEVILLGRDVHFSYQRLTSVANQLRRGATLMVANPDLSHPAADGGVTPETGSLMSAVIACAGVEPVCVVGKPEPLLFREALRRLGTDASTTLVIGDNPLTDGAGARQLAMQCLLVGRDASANVSSLAPLFESDDPSESGDENHPDDGDGEHAGAARRAASQ
ncbi:HAD-IIA family hydrolase [Paraburkholderia sp. ZP32-5]|uniref:HAD-IIA family hydrolase n=1 Tax=Paraburkholderia sp. ZP32-5 TaxID=2883245 RepID=UPI001F41647F|nr:HAD-IIA family hydrolase [Paraburkholderia sp. ZP32-5]